MWSCFNHLNPDLELIIKYAVYALPWDTECDMQIYFYSPQLAQPFA